MKSVKKINVRLLFDTEALEVGSLVLNERNIFFKYSQEFLVRGLDISPFKINLISCNNPLIFSEQTTNYKI